MNAIFQLSRVDVISVVGAVDDLKVTAIIGTGATPLELVEAFSWAEDIAVGNEPAPLSGRVADIVEILADDEVEE